MHVAGLVDLGHGGIDQWVAGPAFTPGPKQSLGSGALFPGDGIVRGLEGALRHMREIAQDLRIKIAPDQFAEPDRGTRAALALQAQGGARQPADGDRAKTQVHPQITRSLDRREVTRGVVLIDTLHEIVKQA